MRGSQRSRGGLESPEARRQLDELRSSALRLFLGVTAVGYGLWHLYAILAASTDREATAPYLILPVVVPILAATYFLLSRSDLAATVVFLGGALVAITWAIDVLDAPRLTTLYVMAALVAAFVVHPLAGIVVTAAAVGLLALLNSLRPGLIAPGDVWQLAVFAALAVGGVAALRYHLFLALDWYAESYARAESQTREAREHRGQLTQALKQLDSAYYRLERANAALQFAWKAADEAERSKMELAVNISHELRTPLNLIAGYSEMMMTSPSSYGGVAVPAPYWGDLHAVYRAAQHLLALTDDVLDLARLEVGRLGLLLEPVDLWRVVRDAAALVTDFVESKGIELRADVPDGLPLLELDRLRVRQVLLNLLGNAARLTERGTIEVRVELRARDVKLSVADTGPGIALEHLPHLFERFATRDRPRGEWHSSTGLGLPISKRFVELHGGEMGVESQLGVGTTIWFTLPLAGLDGGTAEALPRAAASASPRPRQQVLVLAQPDPELARMLQRHLEGYAVEAVGSLSEAEARAVESRAAAIIAGLDAPVDALRGPVPVVSCPLWRTGQLAESLGVADYLVKPVSRESLLQAIRALGLPSGRVLIADDDEPFARLLARMIGSGGSGHPVAVAHNGEEALARMREGAPDVLLLDLAMPVLDGLGVLRAMAADPALVGVKVIAVSARGEFDAALPLGQEVRIRKPEGFQLEELTRVIGSAISQLAPVRAYLADRPTATAPAPPVGPPG